MKQNFADSAFKIANTDGALETELGGLGLGKDASIDEVKATDAVLTTVGSWASQIDKANSAGESDLVKELAENLMDKLMSVDTSNNKVLADNISKALAELSRIKKDGGDTEALKAIFQDMNKSSKSINDKLIKVFESKFDQLIKAVKEADKKSK